MHKTTSFSRLMYTPLWYFLRTIICNKIYICHGLRDIAQIRRVGVCQLISYF